MGFGVVIVVILALSNLGMSKDFNYNEALTKAIVFYQGQRSGKLPSNQTIKWRSNSGLKDGSADNVDLVGGYYDAGDNVKFGFPMAFSTAVLSWSVLEFGNRVPSEHGAAVEAIRWATDYLLKACSKLPHALYVQVGNPWSDHYCWERPEDMDTPRDVYKVTPSYPGSDVAGETAAALAAASLVFRKSDPEYSDKLLATAKAAFTFADKYKGKYSDSLSHVVCPFYCSYSGFEDELLWGAAWLYKATGESTYLNYANCVANEDDSDVFSWDNKLAGSRVLLSSYGAETEKFKVKAERYICSVLPNSPSTTLKYTSGGLMYKMEVSNLQYVTAATFLFSVYAKYLETSKATFSCGSLQVTPPLLKQHAKKQVDYILGDNPKRMSYMVGFGNRFPQKIHHRGSSVPSVLVKSETINCDASHQFLHSGSSNPNVLTGAVVGGPDQSDCFSDDRNSYAQSEPTTYINAPLVGTLFDLASGRTQWVQKSSKSINM